jgi:hypothetical protein
VAQPASSNGASSAARRVISNGGGDEVVEQARHGADGRFDRLAQTAPLRHPIGIIIGNLRCAIGVPPDEQLQRQVYARRRAPPLAAPNMMRKSGRSVSPAASAPKACSISAKIVSLRAAISSQPSTAWAALQ